MQNVIKTWGRKARGGFRAACARPVGVTMPSGAAHRGATLAVCLAVLAAAAGCCPATFECSLRITDEAGLPLAGVSAAWPGGEARSGGDGILVLRRLTHPVMLVLSHENYLDEPVAVGWTDAGATVPVTMLSDGGGRRVVMHFGGDVMLGRRYEDPDDEGDAYHPGDGLIVPGDGGVSARALVSDLAPPFAAADVRCFNFETVVGRFDTAEAYPGKRWILRTDPDALAACVSLGADAVLSGNNHQRDFLEPGIASTLATLAQWGLQYAGSGTSAAQAEMPLILERKGQRIGILTYTTVDGDYVNDSYPRDSETPPVDLAAEDAWQWEQRTWGWAGGVSIPEAARRIGSAWDLVKATDPSLTPEEQAALWASATSVYPELQDWVARRGHGGGALWQADAGVVAVAELRQDVDLLVVNLHSGFQYADVPSPRLRQAAYAAVDAGADLIIGHHPHVLQGFEFYKGKLIAWSLGNLIFDQDLLVTFPSAFLRTVWEDGSLVQARLIPLVLDAYRPLPAVDYAAAIPLRTMWEDGLLRGTAERGDDLRVRTVLPTGAAEEGVEEVRFRRERHSALLSPGLPPAGDIVVFLQANDILPLDASGLVWPQPVGGPLEGAALGRSLFGWGGMEDVDTDALADADATPWLMNSEFKQLTVLRPWNGNRCLQLYRTTTNEADLLVRPVARIPLQDHRVWWDEDTPADGTPSYGLYVAARVDGQEGLARIRLDYYHFDDTDPTVSPVSGLVRSVEYPVDAPADDEWHEIWIDIPPEDIAADGQGHTVSAVMLNVIMVPATRRNTIMYLDDIDLIEWRLIADLPEVWGAWDWVRTSASPSGWLTFRTLPW